MKFFLSISSWAGRAINATHYYGRIRNETYDEVISLEHRIKVNDPRYDDDLLWRRFYTKKTYTTERFCSRKEVIAAAKRWFKKNSKKGDKLII
jgi:hypothetical protein